MVRLKYILLILFLTLSVGCAHKVYVYEDGKRRPNYTTNFHTMDGKLHVSYLMERHKKITVGDESMLMPTAFPMYEGVWLNETDKKVTATIRIINRQKVPYLLFFNQRTKQSFDKEVYKRIEVIYDGRLPYQEHTVEVSKKKGLNLIWFDIYHKGKMYCFTREMIFKY